jgi:hypothetical protein
MDGAQALLPPLAGPLPSVTPFSPWPTHRKPATMDAQAPTPYVRSSMAPRISRRGQRRPSSSPWQAAAAGSSAPPLPWRPCYCSPCLDEEQSCPPCSALLVFHPAGVLLLPWRKISPIELVSLLHGSSSSFLMVLPVRRQPICAAMPVHSSEPHRSTRPWLPSFPSTSAPSFASRQSVQRATTSVSY